MKDRCHNERCKGYKFYGQRGIKVCERWRESFENFIADMGLCPPGFTIERIDNSKGYEPSNCKWASWQEQFKNTRTCRNITFNGETMNASDWERKMGFKVSISRRIRLGWSVERAITTPARIINKG